MLEIIALLTLLSVVATRYLITKHAATLRQQLLELEHACKRHQHQRDQVSEERKSLDDQKQMLTRDRDLLETQLRESRAVLEDQQKRNHELEERLEGMWG
ncbi:MAG: hypothetical protein QGI83_10585 [Candidatus Latescibacteria bacterium]|jgi:septal ring factor EnvC (AmiA/AmiB activator)|nr:hypothetical protein [Candidatus Latescibacterota bacterium]